MNPQPSWPDRLARWWVFAYTSGLPAEARDRRREEITSDLWEHQQAALANGHPRSTTARTVLTRVVAGVPADLSWRMEMSQLERWQHSMDHELAGQHQHDAIAPLAFILRALRPRAEGWSALRCGAIREPPSTHGAAEIIFDVPSVPPVLAQWLQDDGHAFIEGFPLEGSEADVNAYDDALRSASVRLNTAWPRGGRRRHRFSRRSRAVLEARLRGAGLDVRGSEGRKPSSWHS